MQIYCDGGGIVIKKVILNEVYYIENILNNRNISVAVGDIPYVLGTTGKYLYQKEHLKPKQIKDKLYELASRLVNSGGDKYKDLIEKIASGDNKKVPINEIDSIPITEAELKIINNLPTLSEKKLAFTLLCLAKYRNAYIESNDNWETYEFIDIFKMANINVGAKDRAKIMNKLVVGGYIKPSKKITNCNYQIMYVNNDSVTAINVYDYRDLGNTLLSYYGICFDKCETCGRLIKRTLKTKHKKYCDTCKKAFTYNNSNNIYVPVNQRPILTKCIYCGSNVYINPSFLWLGNVCDTCKIKRNLV